MGRTVSFIFELLRPRAVRWLAGFFAVLSAYDIGCNQFGWPKIPRLWGMTGSLLPWWGWLLVLQAILVVALFEYVRRNLPAQFGGEGIQPGLGELEVDIASLRMAIQDIAEDRKAIIRDYQNMCGLEARFTDQLDGLKGSIAAQTKVFEDRHGIDEENLREFREELVRDHSQLFLALQAIRARETERFYAKLILVEAGELERQVQNNEVLEGERWNEWHGHRNKFENALENWLQLGVGWHPKIKEWVNEVDTRSLTLPDWGDIDALVPGTNRMIDYKTTIIRLRNWRRLRNHVASAIHYAAFGGPHAYEVLQHIPGGGPSVERVKEKLDAEGRGETLRRLIEGDDTGGSP